MATPRKPLGTTAKTGERCPESGVWKNENVSYLVGGTIFPCNDSPTDYEHSLQILDYRIRDSVFTLVEVHLFGRLGLPRYHVVVGQRHADQ